MKRWVPSSFLCPQSSFESTSIPASKKSETIPKVDKTTIVELCEKTSKNRLAQTPKIKVVMPVGILNGVKNLGKTKRAKIKRSD